MIDEATKHRRVLTYPMRGELPAGTLDDLLASATHVKVPAAP